MSRQNRFQLSLIGLLAAGCTVGPDYQRPETPVPAAYRGAGDAAAASGSPSFGDLGWWNVFQDPELQELIRTALVENYDLRVAVTRILQAESQVTIARSLQFPTVDATAAAPYSAVAGGDRPPTYPRYSFEPQGGLSAAWELDLWGKFRRNTEAARAALLASAEVRYAVQASLVAQVAGAYLRLRTLDLWLEIARRTVTSRQESRDLVQARLDGGVAGILDLQWAESLLYEATKAVPDIQRQIEQDENLIQILLGRQPGPVSRGRPLTEQLAAPAVPVGLPADLLARRPDIRAAEQDLVAATASIGVAKSELYPALTVSGFAGAGGAVIGGSTFGPFGVFNVLPTVSLPIFHAGSLRAGVRLEEARAQEAALRYQQSVQLALQEVSDSLVEIVKRRESRIQQELLTKSYEDARETASVRYEGGVSSYLEVLDTERQGFNAQLQLAQARLDEYLGVVGLYRALGGGWQAQPPLAPEPSGGEGTGVAVAAAP